MTQNGVINQATGDLLRCGNCDFSTDGAFNASTEAIRTDVPIPAYTKGQPGSTQFTRWNGTAYVLIAATPPTGVFMHAASTIYAQAVTITASPPAWQDIGSVLTTVGFFMSDPTKALGRVRFMAKVTTGTLTVRCVQVSNSLELNNPVQTINTTGGAWVDGSFTTNQPPSLATDEFLIQARISNGGSAEMRAVSLALLQLC